MVNRLKAERKRDGICQKCLKRYLVMTTLKLLEKEFMQTKVQAVLLLLMLVYTVTEDIRMNRLSH